jgi:hypothetical protein
MKRVVYLFIFISAAIYCHGESTISGFQNGHSWSAESQNAKNIEKLATDLLISSDYEAPEHIATKIRWQQALGESHITIAFSKPLKFTFRFSTTGPARLQSVSLQEILIPISHEHSPDYIFVRFHDHIRAFAKFNCDAFTTLRKALP